MFGVAGEKLTMRLRKIVFGTMLRQEIGWFDMEENSTGALCARLSTDASSIQGVRNSTLVQMFRQ
jgi:ATP-binding cassette subfamily B (MDR/TAP) protein 1